ncbi:unnamed protein product [Protopolystoma xenopodis]|uniref:Uncharacterized protein n=1 Tax=Protopolystoma xenopodis TaxID=117903 RepID=A0A3S5BLR2_9PLAT|nr:unnamed protein product [Protopolystoma xenopodis]
MGPSRDCAPNAAANTTLALDSANHIADGIPFYDQSDISTVNTNIDFNIPSTTLPMPSCDGSPSISATASKITSAFAFAADLHNIAKRTPSAKSSASTASRITLVSLASTGSHIAVGRGPQVSHMAANPVNTVNISIEVSNGKNRDHLTNRPFRLRTRTLAKNSSVALATAATAIANLSGGCTGMPLGVTRASSAASVHNHSTQMQTPVAISSSSQQALFTTTLSRSEPAGALGLFNFLP